MRVRNKLMMQLPLELGTGESIMLNSRQVKDLTDEEANCWQVAKALRRGRLQQLNAPVSKPKKKVEPKKESKED